MPIVAGDIDFRLSGGAANSDVNASLGGAKSSTELVDATLHNLFDQVSGDEAQAGRRVQRLRLPRRGPRLRCRQRDTDR